MELTTSLQSDVVYSHVQKDEVVAEPEPPASPLPKGAVNRRRRVSVSAEVDTSKVTKMQ